MPLKTSATKAAPKTLMDMPEGRCHSSIGASASRKLSERSKARSQTILCKEVKVVLLSFNRVFAGLILGIAALIAGFAGTRAAGADTVADFYRGKTVNMLIGVGVGGEYDIQARLVARHIGKHIPGNPAVVSQNMTGAGGLRMAN